jgi:hypothetical protein
MISRSASRSIAGGLASIGVQVLAQSYNRSAVAGTVRRPLRDSCTAASRCHSMTSSARASSVGGMSRARDLAAFVDSESRT